VSYESHALGSCQGTRRHVGAVKSNVCPPIARRENGKETLTVADWIPTVDIEEGDQDYHITAELPGLRKEDVKITLQEGVLTLQGERKQEREEKGKRFHRVERSYGGFVRSFALPDVVDEAKVLAEFKDGVLHIRLPKSEKAKPKAIEVKVV
jgi:HSP20 family protein